MPPYENIIPQVQANCMNSAEPFPYPLHAVLRGGGRDAARVRLEYLHRGRRSRRFHHRDVKPEILEHDVVTCRTTTLDRRVQRVAAYTEKAVELFHRSIITSLVPIIIHGVKSKPTSHAREPAPAHTIPHHPEDPLTDATKLRIAIRSEVLGDVAR